MKFFEIFFGENLDKCVISEKVLNFWRRKISAADLHIDIHFVRPGGRRGNDWPIDWWSARKRWQRPGADSGTFARRSAGVTIERLFMAAI